MEYIIEILIGDVWQQLEIYKHTKVKYNVLVNEIGDPTKRNISHSNTLSIPNSINNRKYLGLNIHNTITLRNGLNKKFNCRIVLNGTILRESYLVINKLTKNDIKINVIDKALELLDKWGSVDMFTLMDQFQYRTNLPAELVTAIDRVKNYFIPPPGTLFGSLGFVTGDERLAIFPNSLNTIGDQFNKLVDETRVPNNRFNSYQSRPIWNAKTFIELICKAFQYTPVYEGISSDVELLKETYIVQSDNEESKDAFSVSKSDKLVIKHDNQWIDGSTYYHTIPFIIPTSTTGSRRSISSLESTYGVDINIPEMLNDTPNYNYKSKFVIYRPAQGTERAGTITYTGHIYTHPSAPYLQYSNVSVYVYELYVDAGQVEYIPVSIEESNPFTLLANSNGTISATVDKASIGINSELGLTFRGLFMMVKIATNTADLIPIINETRDSMLTEQVTDTGKVIYTAQKEYHPFQTMDITKNTPTEKVKKIFSALMVKQSLLSYIDDNEKKVYIYSYKTIIDKILARDYDDWSSYYLRYSSVENNTNFSDKYGKITRISLDQPYPGNSYEYNMASHGDDSKIKDFAENKVEGMKDVSDVKMVNLGGNAYFEYTNKGLGFVERTGFLPQMIQTTSRGEESTLPTSLIHAVSNCNYAAISPSQQAWYGIVDKGIKITEMFLLPLDVVKNINLRRPIYVEEIGHAMIIDSIGEYVDAQTPVEVTLIIPGVIEP